MSSSNQQPNTPIAANPVDRGQSDGDEQVDGAKGATLAVACVAVFMLMVDVTVVNIALPDLQRTYGASFTDLQWVIDAYTLTLAAFLLGGGSLADRLGRKKAFMAGLILFTLASLAAGLSPGILALNISRAFQGVGAAVLFAVAPALIGNEYRGTTERGKAFGIFGAVTGLSLAVGPLVGGLLTEQLSWRWIFLVNVPIGVIALAFSAVRIRESRQPRAAGNDWIGMVVFAAALSLLVLGFLRAQALGWSSFPFLASILAGLALIAVFLIIEQRQGRDALFDTSLLRNRTFAGVCVATLLSNATSLAAVFLLVSYLQNVLQFTPWQTGLRFMPMMLTLFFVAALTGAMLDKIAPGILVATSIALIAIGMGLVALIEPDSGWTALLPAMVIMGVGMGMFNPPRSVLTIGVVEPERSGMAAGMGETFQQFGVAVGIAAFGAMFHHQVVDGFVADDVGGDTSEELAELAAAGGVTAVDGSLTAESTGSAESIRAATQTIFVESLREVMVVAAVVCFVGAVVAILLIRKSDLHETAVDENPPTV